MDMQVGCNVTRRRFIQLGSAGLAGFSLPSCSRRTSEKPSRPGEGPSSDAARTQPTTLRLEEDRKMNPYHPFRMSVQSYCFRKFSLDQAIENTRELGLSYIEFFLAHLPSDLPQPKIDEVKKKLAAAKIEPLAYGVCRFSSDHEANRKVFAFCRAMGTSVITADPAPDSFDSLDHLVSEFDIRVAIHNHGPGHRYAKADDIAKAVAKHDPRIGAGIDTGHLLRAGDDPVKAIRNLKDRMHAVHLKDINEKDRDVVFGTGRLDLRGTLAALLEIKFSGCLSMEYESKPEDPMADMKACLAAVRETIAKLT